MGDQVRPPGGPVIPQGHKFACIAFGHADHEGLPAEILLPCGARVYTAPPFEIGEHWVRWLGSLQADLLAGSELVLLKSAPSANPEVLDHENEKLRRDVVNLMHCLLMQGIPYHEGILEISGAHDAVDLQVRTVAPRRYVRPHAVRPPPVTESMIRRADDAAVGLSAIRDAQVAGSAEHLRLSRGLRSWILGVQEEYFGDRLHLLVRALEALIKPPVGGSKARFKDRGQVLIGASPGHAAVLEELYELRSCAEHLHGPDCDLEDIPTECRAVHATMRGAQAEFIAGEAFLRVLTSPPLLERFRTDATIDAFWALRHHERPPIWGSPIPYMQLTRERFFPEDVD